jgi:hypothetical protein
MNTASDMQSRGSQISARSAVGRVALLLASMISSVSAQVLGVDVFICSPTAFKFQLNFSASCPGNVVSSPGIQGTDCYYIKNSTTNLSPVSVVQIQVIELDLNLESAFVQNYIHNFEDGDSVEYTSLSATNITSPSMIPGGIQLNVRGINSDGDSVTNSFIVDYTNSGTYTPIFEVGNQIGWIVFVSIECSSANSQIGSKSHLFRFAVGTCTCSSRVLSSCNFATEH